MIIRSCPVPFYKIAALISTRQDLTLSLCGARVPAMLMGDPQLHLTYCYNSKK